MKKTILGYAIGPIGSGLLGLITLPILTWFYSTEDIGRIAMLQVVASLSMMLFTLGLDQAYVREYYESPNSPQLLKLAALPGLILIVACYGVVLLFSPTLIAQWMYGIPSSYLSIASVVCFILTLLSRFLSLILRMEERSVAYSMSQVLPKILFLAFILLTLLLAYKRDTANLVTAHTLSLSAVFIIYAWNTRTEWLKAFPQSMNGELLSKLIRYGFPLIIGSLSVWGLNVMDRLFLRSMSTFEELGVYSVVMSFAGAATIIATLFNTIWAPLVLKWSTEGLDTKKIDQISDHLLAAVFFLTVLAGLFSWVITLFLPSQYAPISYLLPICLLGPFFYTLSETTAIGITLSRRTIYSMLASVGAMLANAIGNYLLVPKWGALGAASSTAIAFAIFYTLRTEFACLVWRDIPRLKNYKTILALTTVSVFYGFTAHKYKYALALWAILLIIGTGHYRHQLVLLRAYIDNHMKKWISSDK